MTVQLSIPVRNACGDAIEATVGPSAILKIREGAAPANCAAADTGTVLATLNLPADWMAAFSGGAGSKAGTWQDTSADASGTLGHFRIYASDGVTCGAQGTCTKTGSGGDIQLDNGLGTDAVTAGQVVTITAATIEEGNP